jgi:hypothetical protein
LSGSGSDFFKWLGPDPDPQHWLHIYFGAETFGAGAALGYVKEPSFEIVYKISENIFNLLTI